jgi:hypothetical protein
MGYCALINLSISSEDMRHLYLLTGRLLCLVTDNVSERQSEPV